MLSFSNYENFETNSLKNYLNDDENNNIGDLRKEQVEYLFKNSNLDEKLENTNQYQQLTDDEKYKSSDSLTLKHEKLDGTIEKLNHIIHLLEQQQDEKTETVMEELILYLFLGFFIIYIIDSFFRAGKYYR